MSLKYTISNHALHHINNRANITLKYLQQLLENNVFVEVGKSDNLRKKHLLIYSINTNEPMVCIVNTTSNNVITLLPLDYHANTAWHISDEFVQQIKKLTFTFFNDTYLNYSRTKISLKLEGITLATYNKPQYIHVGYFKNISVNALLSSKLFIDCMNKVTHKVPNNYKIDNIILSLDHNIICKSIEEYQNML